MPKMVSLKRPKKTKKQLKEEIAIPCCGEDDKYPYGTRINLHDEEVKKLGIEGLQAGQTVTITAKANVEEVMKRDGRNGKEGRVELQITDMAIKTSGKDDKKSADKIFDEASK